MTGTHLPFLPELAADLETIVAEAGMRALEDFRPGGETRADITWKADDSPVTSADLALDRLIGERIADLDRAKLGAPSIRFHSEERPDSWSGGRAGLVAVLDPIDGTRAFMKGETDWCISLGLTFDGEPVAGILFVPARGEMFTAHHGGRAWLNGTRLKPGAKPAGLITASGPRGVVEAFSTEARAPISLAPHIAALAHRLVRPLTGDFDLALSRSGGRDWDLIAADCILREAGAALVTHAGRRPAYGLDGGFHPELRSGSLDLLQSLMPSLLTPDAGAAKRGQ